VGDHQTAAPTRETEAEGRPTACAGSSLPHWDRLRAEERHPLGDAPAGDELRQRHDVLAALAGLDPRRRLEEAPARVAQPTSRRRPDRLVESRHGCLHRAGEKGGSKTGPTPTNRGKPGTKRHLVTDRKGIPLAELTTRANVNETTVLERLIDAIPPVRGKRGRPRKRPEKLHADKAYRSRKNQRALWRRRIKSRIARPGIESSEKLGRHRWVVERTIAWKDQMRRLVIRYERRADIYDGFHQLGCALICFNFLKHTF
jgi:transposase